MKNLLNLIVLGILILSYESCSSQNSENANNNDDTVSIQPKWNPGHYIFAGDPSTLVSKINNKKNWKGIKVNFNWRDFEPDQSTLEDRIYDFSELKSAYEEVASAGKHIVVMVSYKSFNTPARNNLAAPLWIYESDGVIEYAKPNGEPIDFARLWIPWVREAFLDMISAMATEFDDLPYFEGIQFQETAGSSVNQYDNSHSHEKYKEALIDILTETKKVFVKSNVWQHGNHEAGTPGLLTLLYQHIYEIGAGMGGPDTYMDRSDASKDELPNWVGKVPLALDHQRPQQLFNGYTPEDVFLRITETWPMNHVMWNSKEDVVPTPGLWGEKWGFTEVDAMLNNPPNGYPPFHINDTLPENLKKSK